MKRDVGLTEFLRLCYGNDLPEHMKAWVEHMEAGGTEKPWEIILHPRVLRPRRRLRLVPGVRYVCPINRLEHYRNVCRGDGLVLVEVPMSQPGASVFEVTPSSKATNP